MRLKLALSPFYWTVFRLALPVTVQQIVTSSSSIVDNLMVSVLGTEPIGAVGAVGKFLQIFFFAVYGVSSSGAGFIAQFSARKDEKGVQRVMGATLFCNIILAILFTVFSILHTDRIVDAFTKDPATKGYAKEYLLVMSFGYIFHSISFTYSFALRTIKKASLALYIILFSQMFNVFFNHLLIQGNGPFPALGVKGAALASVLAKVIEMFLILFFVYRNGYPIAGTLKTMLDFPVSFLFRFLEIAFPLTLNELLWALGLAIYQIFFGRMGSDAMAAYSMIAPFEQFFITAFIGFSSAALVMVGEYIGENKRDEAYDCAVKFYKISLFTSIVLGSIIFISADKIISIYSYMGDKAINDQAVVYGVNLLRILGLGLFIRVYNLVSYAGILKSSGDSLFLFISETFSLWLVGVPLAFLASHTFKMEPHYVYGMLYVEEGFKAFLVARRFSSKKWIKNLIDI